MACKQQRTISQRSGGWKSKTGMPAWSGCGEAPFGAVAVNTSLCARRVEGMNEPPGPLYKGTFSFIGPLPSWPHHLPKAPPYNAIL